MKPVNEEDLEFLEAEIEEFIESLEGGTLAFPEWALNESSVYKVRHWLKTVDLSKAIELESLKRWLLLSWIGISWSLFYWVLKLLFHI